MENLPEMTLEEIYVCEEQADKYALMTTLKYLPKTGDLVTIPMLEDLFTQFSDHMVSLSIFNYYTRYIFAVIGRQLRDPTEDIFIPSLEEDLSIAVEYFNNPESKDAAFSFYVNYYVPLILYATTYFTMFSYFFDPLRRPEKAAEFGSYSDFRNNNTCVAIQMRYNLIRKYDTSGAYRVEDTGPKGFFDFLNTGKGEESNG